MIIWLLLAAMFVLFGCGPCQIASCVNGDVSQTATGGDSDMDLLIVLGIVALVCIMSIAFAGGAGSLKY